MARGARRRDRRGGIVIIVAISLAVLSGFVALSFDIGYARLMRTRLDMALEAASHAAALELDGTDDGVDEAISAAIAMAEKATIVGETLSISNDDVEFGVWDDNLRTFSSETDATLINAVRVSADVTIPLFFGLIAFDEDSVGGLDLNVTQLATSGVPGPARSSPCVLPLVIPSCHLDADGDDTLDVGAQGKLFDAGGCANTMITSSSYLQAFMATPGAFSVGKVKNLLTNCEEYGTISMDDALGAEVFIRVDHASLNNSGGVMETIATTIGSSTTSLDSRWTGTPTHLTGSVVTSANYGKTIEGPIPVVEFSGWDCDSAIGNDDTEASALDGVVIGFVWGAIYDAQKRCVKDGTGAAAATCSFASGDKCSLTVTGSGATAMSNADRNPHLRFRIDVDNDYEVQGASSGGDLDWGVLGQGTIRLIPQ